MIPSPQVEPSHYIKSGYLTKERWLNYWYQLSWIRSCAPTTVLEIGVGNGLMQMALQRIGITVETVDIDQKLHPTYLASVQHLPLKEDGFDLVLCAEVLEHLPFEESCNALKEIHRVTRKYALITLPHSGFVFSLLMKIPLFPWITCGFKIPHWWKRHIFQGEHYWELGKKQLSRSKFMHQVKQTGFTILTHKINPDDPAHVFFLCKKNDITG